MPTNFVPTTLSIESFAAPPEAAPNYWNVLAEANALDQKLKAERGPELDTFSIATTPEEIAARTGSNGPSFGSLWNASVGLDHVIPAMMEADMWSERKGDPNFQFPAPEEFAKMAEERGIPVDWYDEFDDILSASDLERKFLQLQNRQADEAFVANAGGRGMAARLAASMLDPVGVAVDSAASVFGGAGVANRFRRIGQVVTAAGASSAAVGALQGQANPDYGMDSFAVDFAAGSAFGVAFESAATAFSKTERNALARDIEAWAERGQQRFGKDTLSAARRTDVPGADPIEVSNFNMETSAGGDAFKELEDRATDNFNVGSVWAGVRRSLPSLDDASSHFAQHGDEVVRQMGRDAMMDPVRRVRHMSNGDAVDEVNTDGFTDAAERHARVLFGAGFRSEAEQAMAAQAAQEGFVGRLRQKLAPEYQRAFYERVGRMAKGFTDDATDPNVIRAYKALDSTMQDTLRRAQKAGVQGAERVELRAGYFPRYRKRDLAVHLRDAAKGSTDPLDQRIAELVGLGIKSALRQEGREISDEVTEKVSKHYAEYIWTGSTESTRRGAGMTTPDMNYIDEVLEEAGIDRETIDSITDGFKVKDEQGVASDRFKPRLAMDETVSIKLDNGKELRLADLFETDASYATERYTREMAGKIAMAERGYKNWRDWFTIIDRKVNVDKTMTEREANILRNAGNHALGRPLKALGSESEIVNKAATTLGGLNFLRVMGSVGWAAVSEIAKVISYGGVRAFARHVPAFAEIVRQVSTGVIETQLAREMSQLSAAGTTLLRTSTGSRFDEFHQTGLDSSPAFKALDKANHVAQRIQAVASGLAPITDITQQLAARTFAQKMYDYAHAAKEISKADMNRLLDYGLSRNDFTRLKAFMRKHSEGTNGTLTKVNLDAMPDDLQEVLGAVISRGVRHAVLEPSFASTSPLMHGPLMSLVFQFRRFSYTAFSRHTLHGMSRMDATAGLALMLSATTGTLAVLGRTYINYGGESEQFKQLGDIETLAKRGFQATGESSVMPMLFDTMLSMLGEKPYFGHAGRNTDLATGFVLGNPTVDLALKGMRTMGMPANALRSDRENTQKEVKDGLSMLPFANLMGAKRFINAVSEPFPEEDINRTE